VLIQHALNQYFNLATTGFMRKQTRRQHPCIVEYQQVTRTQQHRQIAHGLVTHVSMSAIQQQQAAVRTLPQRLLGNQFGRQFKLEITAFDGKTSV